MSFSSSAGYVGGRTDYNGAKFDFQSKELVIPPPTLPGQSGPTLTLETSKRINPTSTTSDSCTIMLSEAIYNVKGLSLLFSDIPNTIWTFDATENLIYITDNGDPLILTIANGIYDQNSFPTYLAAALQTLTGDTFTVTYSNTLRNLTFTNTTLNDFSFTFGTNTLNSAAKRLGFANVNTPSGTTFTTPYMLDLASPAVVCVTVDEMQSTIIRGSLPYSTSYASTTATTTSTTSSGIVIAGGQASTPTTTSTVKNSSPCTFMVPIGTNSNYFGQFASGGGFPSYCRSSKTCIHNISLNFQKPNGQQWNTNGLEFTLIFSVIMAS
jgi:hypothetical protein